jgi:hypothetical protein
LEYFANCAASGILNMSAIFALPDGAALAVGLARDFAFFRAGLRAGLDAGFVAMVEAPR